MAMMPAMKVTTVFLGIFTVALTVQTLVAELSAVKSIGLKTILIVGIKQKI